VVCHLKIGFTLWETSRRGIEISKIRTKETNKREGSEEEEKNQKQKMI
jgi:hypothetical protein